MNEVVDMIYVMLCCYQCVSNVLLLFVCDCFVVCLLFVCCVMCIVTLDAFGAGVVSVVVSCSAGFFAGDLAAFFAGILIRE